uniref:Uncharacterized protein n=1 Tax=Oncorhynchus tshawytscha TaxID=74940 RepID=A0AAZ3SI42_ONCTS
VLLFSSPSPCPRSPASVPPLPSHPPSLSGLEVSKQRLLSENNLTLTFEIQLKMLCACVCVYLCVRRVGVELEDSSVGVPIIQFHTYTL